MLEVARQQWMRRIASAGSEYVKANQLRDGDVIARHDQSTPFGTQADDPEWFPSFLLTPRRELERRFAQGDTVTVRNPRAERGGTKGTAEIYFEVDSKPFSMSARQGVVRAVR